VCLRLWNGILDSSPTLSSRGHHDLLMRLWQFTGVPLLVGKTHPDFPSLPLCPFRAFRAFRASCAMQVSRMERLALAVFGAVAHPLPDCPPHPENAPSKVHVAPLQTEKLTLAHPGGDGQDVEGLKPLPLAA